MLVIVDSTNCVHNNVYGRCILVLVLLATAFPRALENSLKFLQFLLLVCNSNHGLIRNSGSLWYSFLIWSFYVFVKKFSAFSSFVIKSGTQLCAVFSFSGLRRVLESQVNLLSNLSAYLIIMTENFGYSAELKTRISLHSHAYYGCLSAYYNWLILLHHCPHTQKIRLT